MANNILWRRSAVACSGSEPGAVSSTRRYIRAVARLWNHAVHQYVDRPDVLSSTEGEAITPLAVCLDSFWIAHKGTMPVVGINVAIC